MKPALAVLFLAFSALAAEPAEMINKATCTKGAETRELEITAKDEGHTVTYTRGGAAKVVGTCSTTKEKCQAVFDNLKSNLEKAGFTCKI